MNFAYLTEYYKLGLRLPRNEEFFYRHLKSSLDDIYKVDQHTSQLSPLYSARFCNSQTASHILAVANEDGTVCIHDTRHSRRVTKQIYRFQAHYNAIFDLTWLENDVKLVTMSGDHTALLWDVGQSEAVPIVRMVGHQGSVKSVACKPGDPNSFTTGGRDGVIMQWDIRENTSRINESDNGGIRSVKADNILKFSHLTNWSTSSRYKNVNKKLLTESPQCISSVVYQNSSTIVSSASTDRCIKVWDTRKSYSAFVGVPTPLHTLARKTHSTNRTGYTSLVVSPCRLKLYAYSTDAKLYCFDVGTYRAEPVFAYRGPGTSSFFCKINMSPDGRYLSSGSSDANGYVWSAAYPETYLVALDGHAAEVTCVDWCKHGDLKLVSCSDDGTYMIWKIPKMDSDKENAFGGIAKHNPPLESSIMRHYPKKCYASHLRKSRKRLRSENDDFRTPKKQCVTPKKLAVVIGDMPNFVLDGKSPHDPSFRASTTTSEGDWLSRLIASTPPAKPTSSAKKNKRTPTQNSKSSVRGSLLKYFKKPEDGCGEATITEHNDERTILSDA